MALPKAIQREVQAAEDITSAMQAQAASTQLVTDVSQLSQPPAANDAQPQTVATPAQPAAAPQAPDKTEAYWEQRFKTVIGMQQVEMPKLHSTIKTLESTVTSLKSELDQVKATKQQSQQTQPSVDPKDVEAFGSEMIEMVRRYAEQTFTMLSGQFEGKFAAVDGRVARLEEVVTGVNTRAVVSQEAQFYTTLTQLVSDWEEINQEDRWKAWLAEVDPVYGVPRQAALDAAFDRDNGRFDASRAANVFKAYRQTFPKKSSEALASQVAPSGAAGTAPSMQAAPKPIFTEKAIQDFYNDVARGKYAGRETEQQRLEGEINLAAAEGRIKPR